MTITTTRAPFTKPLTGQEMRYIQRLISEAAHGAMRSRKGPSQLITHEEMVAEVEGAIAFFNAAEERSARRRELYRAKYSARRRQHWHEQQAAKRGSCPSFCKASEALSALSGA